MTSGELQALKPGTTVLIFWPGSNSAVDTKRAKLHRVNKAGTKVAVYVARTSPKGEYTGQWGTSPRWFPAEDVVGVLP